MKSMVDVLWRFRWVLLAVAGLTFLVWFFVVAIGGTIGVSPDAQASVKTAFGAVWKGAITLLVPLVLRDRDGDGVPDVLDRPTPDPGVPGLDDAGAS